MCFNSRLHWVSKVSRMRQEGARHFKSPRTTIAFTVKLGQGLFFELETLKSNYKWIDWGEISRLQPLEPFSTHTTKQSCKRPVHLFFPKVELWSWHETSRTCESPCWWWLAPFPRPKPKIHIKIRALRPKGGKRRTCQQIFFSWVLATKGWQAMPFSWHWNPTMT